MGWLKKAVKSVKAVAKLTPGGVAAGLISRAAGNISDKGMGALTLGQITGSDRAKLLAERADAAAAAAGDPALQAAKDEAAKQVDMPTIDSAAVEAARKKAALLAAARGGRASTMLSDKVL